MNYGDLHPPIARAEGQTQWILLKLQVLHLVVFCRIHLRTRSSTEFDAASGLFLVKKTFFYAIPGIIGYNRMTETSFSGVL